METLGAQPHSTFSVEEALYKAGPWTSHSPLVLLAPGWYGAVEQEGKPPVPRHKDPETGGKAFSPQVQLLTVLPGLCRAIRAAKASGDSFL